MSASAAGALVQVQELMRDWADARRLPFGIPVPKTAVPVTAMGFAAIPAAFGTQVLVVTYQARPAWYALLTGIVLQFAGTGPAPRPGDVRYVIDIDRPLGDTVSGYDEKDYAAVPFLLGSQVTGPIWPVEFHHENGETVRIKATAVANMGHGAGNFFVAALVGYEWPKQGFEG